MKQKKAKKKKFKHTERNWSWKNKETGDVQWDVRNLAKTKKRAEELCDPEERVVRVEIKVREI